MKKRIFPKSNIIFWVIIILFSVVIPTFSTSSAKYVSRYEYALKLAMVEHITFSPGKVHIYEIPYDGYYAIQLWGGAGGASRRSGLGGEAVYQFGGRGGMVKGVSYFSEGTILHVFVGERGGFNIGGFNGGGDGGSDNSSWFDFYAGGGGGGATDIRLFPGSIDDRILIAGGGGGGSSGGGWGGNGGADAGNYAGANGDGSGYGQGGGQFFGGDGFEDGSFGYGGRGNWAGGGGGGGYFGGGGAYGSSGGGGGGSAYIADRFTISTPYGLPEITDYLTDTSDGYAIISFLGSRYVAREPMGLGGDIRYDIGEPTQEGKEFSPQEEPEIEVGSESDPRPFHDSPHELWSDFNREYDLLSVQGGTTSKSSELPYITEHANEVDPELLLESTLTLGSL